MNTQFWERLYDVEDKGHIIFSDCEDFCNNNASFPKIMSASQIFRYVLFQKFRSNETRTRFVLHTPFSIFSDWRETFLKLRTCYRREPFCSSFVTSMGLGLFRWLLQKKYLVTVPSELPGKRIHWQVTSLTCARSKGSFLYF